MPFFVFGGCNIISVCYNLIRLYQCAVGATLVQSQISNLPERIRTILSGLFISGGIYGRKKVLLAETQTRFF